MQTTRGYNAAVSMAPSPDVSEPRLSPPSMLRMGLMMAGANAVDVITATMLPITARHFTGNITLIGTMVALNRICGFLVQPYAAWKSDGHLSSRGRRRPFLLGAWPAVFISMAILGGLPFIVPAEHHRTLVVVSVLFLVNLVMQAALDVCFGTGDPMYGDTFTAGDLGRANGVRMTVTAGTAVAMTLVFVPLADRHEFWPYAGALGFVGASFLITCFGLRERLPASLPPPASYHPLKPLAELRNPQTRNVAICGSAVLVSLALTDMLHALFVTETLGFSKTVLGTTATAALIAHLIMPYPVGWLVDRIGPRAVLITGFILLAGVEAAFVFWVESLTSLYIGLISFRAAWVVVHLPMLPLIFQNTPAERRGAIFAAVQMTRAGVTSIATILAAALAGAVGSYRMCYLVAGIVCLIGLFGAIRLVAVPRLAVAAPAGA